MNRILFYIRCSAYSTGRLDTLNMDPLDASIREYLVNI